MASGGGRRDAAVLATAIAAVTPEHITIRGYDLCADLIGRVSFTDHVFLLVAGTLPTAAQRAVTDAVLVAIAEHGLVPSVQAARMTLSAGPEAWQGAVAAGILGCGSVVLGSSEVAGRLLNDALASADHGGEIVDAATRTVDAYRESGRPLPGFGYPAASDPRVPVLFSVAESNGVLGSHVKMLQAIAEAIPAVYGRALPINVSGAIPAVMLDAGFPLAALKGLPILARTAGLIGHLMEESVRSIGPALAKAAQAGAAYDGPLSPPGGAA